MMKKQSKLFKVVILIVSLVFNKFKKPKRPSVWDL